MTLNPPKLEEILQAIHDGRITVSNLPKELYYAIIERLKKGLYEGFGGDLTDFSGRDLELLEALRENVYMFSAAKTYQQVREMQELLIGDNGVLPFNKFRDEALKIYERYNVAWLEAEYNTAIGQAQMCSKWADIERNKKYTPILEYSAIGDACKICKPLDGIRAPVDDIIWRIASPLNHFGCFCVLKQLSDDYELTDPATLLQVRETFSERVSDQFKMNPYYDKVVFNESSPYFTNIPEKDVNLALNNFNLPIPPTDVNSDKK